MSEDKINTYDRETLYAEVWEKPVTRPGDS